MVRAFLRTIFYFSVVTVGALAFVAYCSEVMREQAVDRRDNIWVWRTLP